MAPVATAEQVAAAIDVLRDLPALVRETRLRRGLSYRDAAHVAGVSRSCWHGVEHRGRDPGVIITLRLLRWVYDGEGWS
jgi:DNA-binding XRE family transcriptional regulator